MLLKACGFMINDYCVSVMRANCASRDEDLREGSLFSELMDELSICCAWRRAARGSTRVNRVRDGAQPARARSRGFILTGGKYNEREIFV